MAAAKHHLKDASLCSALDSGDAHDADVAAGTDHVLEAFPLVGVGARCRADAHAGITDLHALPVRPFFTPSLDRIANSLDSKIRQSQWRISWQKGYQQAFIADSSAFLDAGSVSPVIH